MCLLFLSLTKMGRTPSCDKSGLRKGTWTLGEDMKLIAYVTRYGCWNWSQLPKFAGLARCGKSCRLRWLNYLRPNLKRGNFTQQEEDLIIRLHTKLGNRWSVIASNLPGRTDNEIKNHWHTNLKKRLQQKGVTKEGGAKASKSKDNESRPEMDLLQNNDVLQVAPPATSQKSECTSPLSPLSSSSEFSSIASDHNKAAISNENLVLEHDFAFLDAYTEPVIENFWTEPCMAELSYATNEMVPDHDNHDFQSPDSIQIPDASVLMSPQPALENEFVFLDTNIETMIENFWSEPYMHG